MTFLSGLNSNFSVFINVSNREASVRGLFPYFILILISIIQESVVYELMKLCQLIHSVTKLITTRTIKCYCTDVIYSKSGLL